jgi:hypothetical protein
MDHVNSSLFRTCCLLSQLFVTVREARSQAFASGVLRQPEKDQQFSTILHFPLLLRPYIYEEVDCAPCPYTVHLMSLTLLRVDSLRPDPLSLPIGSASVKSDPCVVKEEARQEVQVFCREGISLVLSVGSSSSMGNGGPARDEVSLIPGATASSSELPSHPTAATPINSEEENQSLAFTFFATNASIPAVILQSGAGSLSGTATNAALDSVQGPRKPSASLFPPLPLRGGTKPSDCGVPLASIGCSLTTINVPRETLVPYDTQTPGVGRLKAGPGKKRRKRFVSDKGFQQVEVSESESDEESGPFLAKQQESPWVNQSKASPWAIPGGNSNNFTWGGGAKGPLGGQYEWQPSASPTPIGGPQSWGTGVGTAISSAKKLTVVKSTKELMEKL